MKHLVLVLALLSGCLDTAVDNTIGQNGLGLAPDVGFVYDCDLITQIGGVQGAPPIDELHAVSHPCLHDGDQGKLDLDAYEQVWIDDVCTPALVAAGHSGGCYGDCKETHSWCWL